MNEINRMLAVLQKQVETDITKKNCNTPNNSSTDAETIKEREKVLEQQETTIEEEDLVIVEGDGKKVKPFYMCRHTVTQKEFEEIMGINPSWFQHRNDELNKDKKELLENDTSDYPVEMVSLYDAIYYCNKKSIQDGLTPVYSLDKENNVLWWEYDPCQRNEISDAFNKLKKNPKADGYRLPTRAEWKYAAKDKEDICEKSWIAENSDYITHKVMQKQPNKLGLYDMIGNICEWTWEANDLSRCRACGGNYSSNQINCSDEMITNIRNQCRSVGFRVVRSMPVEEKKEIVKSLIEKSLIEDKLDISSCHSCGKKIHLKEGYKCRICGEFTCLECLDMDAICFTCEEKLSKTKIKDKILKSFVNIYVKMSEEIDFYFSIMKTQVTQKLYEKIMDENPSYNIGKNNPVEMVSWYDAIYFCNKLSKFFGYEPIYSVDGNEDESLWGYIPHKGNDLTGKITMNPLVNGFRLPTQHEWLIATGYSGAYPVRHYVPYQCKYAGSNILEEVGWYEKNSGGKTHPVAQKARNEYGLHDMSGNVWEWLWNKGCYGGCFESNRDDCIVNSNFPYGSGGKPNKQDKSIGFRVVRSSGINYRGQDL